LTARTSRIAFLAAVLAAATFTIPAIFARPATQQIQIPATESSESEGPLVDEGPEPDLALIYTGGVAGYVDPCG